MKENQELILLQDLGMQYPKEISKKKRRYGIYKCPCGKEFKSMTDNIKCGAVQSCGCYHKQIHTRHGLRYHPIYMIWKNMLRRTTNEKDKSFRYYGDRGITVCKRWMNVENFIEDMSPSFIYGLRLDRINNDGNYEPSNCRWTTPTVQARNTRQLYAHNTSGYRGVDFLKSNGKWRARVSINRKIKPIGYFKTALEAARAYDRYVLENNLEHTTNGV